MTTTPYTVTALTRLASELAADAELSLYVDTIETWDADRADSLPDLTRHGIALVADAIPVPSPLVTTHNLERFTVRIRLFLAVWDPTDPAASVTGTSTSGGVGASTVGMLKFTEDVQNALRLNTLSDLLESTGIEADRGGAIATITSVDRDRIIKETTLLWVGEYVAPHDRS